jgi:hypothetical protein
MAEQPATLFLALLNQAREQMAIITVNHWRTNTSALVLSEKCRLMARDFHSLQASHLKNPVVCDARRQAGKRP